MPKNILIFSDGTGQRGGLRPDQRLSNVYKMYRAMRPGPESPIAYSDQVAFYDPGLGAGEIGSMFSFIRRMKNIFEAAVGTGIDSNMVECYENILSEYEDGDRVMLFGFSRGAYTVRALANVMNLCGVPTRLPDGGAIPRDGPQLRAIAREAVKTVYGHGAGKKRAHSQYYPEREEKGRRFRAKYGSAPAAGEADVQGNVQPHFIGVFDTVAALGDRVFATIFGVMVVTAALFVGYSYVETLNDWKTWAAVALLTVSIFWYLKVFSSQIRYFEPDPDNPLRWFKPWDWPAIFRHTHRASWDKKHYDKWLDADVGYARHAMAIYENRKNFPRVKWGSMSEVRKNAHKTNPLWLDQVWFSGCHSDIGGSYHESESRLSDIAMAWMVGELTSCYPSVRINGPALNLSPDAEGLQHSEDIFLDMKFAKIPWPRKPREVEDDFRLHPTVILRLESGCVPHPGEIKPYRPPQLQNHPQARKFYE